MSIRKSPKKSFLVVKMNNTDGMIDKLKAHIVDSVIDQICTLCDIWNEVGIYNEILDIRCDTIAQNYHELMNTMIEEEENLVENLKKENDKLLNKVASLSEDLRLPFKEPNDRLTLLEKQRTLKETSKQLENEKSKRLQSWQGLENEMKTFASLMRIMYPNVKFSASVPSLAEIESLEMQVSDVKWEFSRIKKQLEEYKIKIKMRVAELDYVLEPQERIFVSDVIGDLMYSTDNLKIYKAFIAKLDKVKKYNLSKIHSYKEELKKPFEFEKEGERMYDKENFDQFCPASGSLVKTLKDQVHTKKKRVESTIGIKQARLVQLWDLCQVIDERTNEMKDLLSDVEIVDHKRLKEEIESLETYYNENKDVFDLHKAFRDAFAELSEAEKRCICASKRLNNLSYTKEEKPRNRLLKEVMQIQEVLTAKVISREEKNRARITFKGMNINEYLKQINDHLNANKDVWRSEGSTPSALRRQNRSGNLLKTPMSQRKEDANKFIKRSENRLSNRQGLQEPAQPSTARSNRDVAKHGIDLKPPKPSSVLRKFDRLNIIPRLTKSKPMRPLSSNNNMETKIEFSEIENLEEYYFNTPDTYEDFYKSLAGSGKSFISSSILEDPNLRHDQQKRHFFMPPF